MTFFFGANFAFLRNAMKLFSTSFHDSSVKISSSSSFSSGKRDYILIEILQPETAYPPPSMHKTAAATAGQR